MRKKTQYICSECGTHHSKWIGKCEGCSAWNTIQGEVVEIKQAKLLDKTSKINSDGAEIFDLNENIDTNIIRYNTGINEFDRVLGGGMVKGSAILIAGEPGIGKSTLLLQFAASISIEGFDCLYVSGEESAEQIKMRASRLGLSSSAVKIATTSSLADILNILKKIGNTGVVIIDSIQTLYNELIESTPGTVTQVRSCAFELIKKAKQDGWSLILVGHVTKEGQIAGPKVLEHMVDTVIYFEGENAQHYRIIRAIKNRYGPANEIGVFEMSGNGLQEVKNPSAIFMPSHNISTSGSCIFAGLEGTRPLMVEVQALVAPSFLATPRRTAIGWDTGRLSMMIAILHSRYGLNLTNKEVYLNVVGGLKILEPAADLAVAVALISASLDFPIPSGCVFFGEVGLSGELRQVTQYESRLNEAIKLGLTHAIMPFERKKIACNIERTWLTHIGQLRKLFAKKKDLIHEEPLT